MGNDINKIVYAEYFVDRKLDNKRVPINDVLVKFSYNNGDEKISREEISYKSRSGYCLDSVNGGNTIGFDDIGKLREYRCANTGARNPQWNIIAYMHKEQEALDKLKGSMLKYKQSLLKQYEAIPV